MELDELLERLSRSEAVNAVAVVGSAAEGALNPASDYDLLIVLEDPPLPIMSGVSHVDGRIADMIFSTAEDLRRLAAIEPSEAPVSEWDGAMFRWALAARIEVDRQGLLARVKEKAPRHILVPPTEGRKMQRLDKAGYNLAHTTSMLRSSDPVYHQAIELRMLYQLADLMADYFAVRDMPWRGEKAAVRHWQAYDVPYLELFLGCAREVDLAKKVDLYRRLAELTMAPVGPLWSMPATAFRLDPPDLMTLENLAAARRFWESLVG